MTICLSFSPEFREALSAFRGISRFWGGVGILLRQMLLKPVGSVQEFSRSQLPGESFGTTFQLAVE